MLREDRGRTAESDGGAAETKAVTISEAAVISSVVRASRGRIMRSFK